MQRAIDARRRQRQAEDGEAAARPQHPSPEDLGDVISRWYRQLCLDYHPDRGGSKEAMQVVNEAYERLRKLLGV